MAATRFLALALFMIFLENGAFLGKPLHLDPTMNSSSVRHTRVLTMKSNELVHSVDFSLSCQFVVPAILEYEGQQLHGVSEAICFWHLEKTMFASTSQSVWT